MGFTGQTVDSGVAAVVAARSQVPNLILIDLQLRDVSASETIGWLRSNQQLAVVPVIVLGSADRSRRLSRDIHSVTKPLSSSAIERAVSDLCS